MPTNPFFVVLEGIDFTGKSCIAEAIARQTGAGLLSTPPRELIESGCREKIDRLYENCGLAAQLFYCSTVAHASQRIREDYLQKGRSVVLDRYLASTVVYDEIFHRSGFSEQFWIDGLFREIAKPDMVFYLQASDEIRRQRAARRRKKSRADRDSFACADALEARYREVFELLDWTVCCIGSDAEKTVCVKECLTALRNRGYYNGA